MFVRAGRPHARAPCRAPTVQVKAEIGRRRADRVSPGRVVFPGVAPVENPSLAPGEKLEMSRDTRIPQKAGVSAPYWLAEASLPGRHVVSDRGLVGEPAGPPALVVQIELGLEDRVVRLTTPVVYA